MSITIDKPAERRLGRGNNIRGKRSEREDMRQARQRQSNRLPSASEVPLQVPRMLIVDDDPDFQTSLELRFRKYDVEIEQAYFGCQGIVESGKLCPDLILMDQAMPNGDGEYLLEIVKHTPSTSDTPVIVLTGMRDPNLKSRLLHGGADVFLNKPINFDELVHHVSRFIDLREKQD